MWQAAQRLHEATGGATPLVVEEHIGRSVVCLREGALGVCARLPRRLLRGQRLTERSRVCVQKALGDRRADAECCGEEDRLLGAAEEV
jgi:hypothetical protein